MNGRRLTGNGAEGFCYAPAVNAWTRHWCVVVRLFHERCALRRPEPLWRAPRCIRDELAGRGTDACARANNDREPLVR